MGNDLGFKTFEELGIPDRQDNVDERDIKELCSTLTKLHKELRTYKNLYEAKVEQIQAISMAAETIKDYINDNIDIDNDNCFVREPECTFNGDIKIVLDGIEGLK